MNPYSRAQLEKLTKEQLIALVLARPPSGPGVQSETARQKSQSPEHPPTKTGELSQKDKDVRHGNAPHGNAPPPEADLHGNVAGKTTAIPHKTYLYQQIAENFPNGALAVMDRNGNYQFITGKELEKLGKNPDDFLGKPFGVLPISDETRQDLHAAFQRALQGENSELEVSFQSSTYTIYTIPLRSEQEKVTQVLVILQNITDQKKALHETQYQKAQLESLIENVDDAIWSIDRDNRLMLGNSAFYYALRRLYQTEIRPGEKIDEAVTYENFMRAFRSTANPEEFLQKWYHYQQRALQGEKLTAEIHYPFRFRDISIRISFNPVYNAQKQVIGVTLYVHDVTDLRRALRHAQEQEQQFKALAENIPGVVYIVTKEPTCRCIYISDQIEELTGYSAQEFREGKRNIQEFLHLEDRESTRESYIQSQQQQRPYHFVYRLKHRTGQYHWVEERGVVIDLGTNRVFQGVIMDITDKHRYEEQLKRQNQDLRKINEELDYFAYSVSHDLRAPLTSAMGLLTLLQDEDRPEQQKEYAAIINHNLYKLDAFIQDIILLSKNARTELDTDAINFKELLADILESQKYGPEFELVHIYSDVRQTQPFHSDRRRLKIILNNLISNALKYSFSRREHPFAQITITTTDTQSTLVVRDNGIGIQEEHIPHIFNMFYRGTDRKSGSGLGLYLVRETLEKLGGSIEVESVYGEGTTFTVDIPALREDDGSE